MNKTVRELIISSGIYDCICDPYDQLKNGDADSSIMIDLERLAALIINECLDQCYNNSMNSELYEGHLSAADCIKKHFGVSL